MEQDQKNYELVCILPPYLEGEDLEKSKKEIQEIISKFESEIDFKEAEKRELAYPINKQRQGLFLVSRLSIAPDNVNNLSKELKLNKQVLRHLISRLPVIKPGVKKAKSKKIIKKIKRKPSYAKATKGKASLEEIDKKLDDIIDKI